MVHRAITHVELVHHVHHTHDDLRVMRSVAVDFHVEDMSTACQVVIRCLHLGLMTG